LTKAKQHNKKISLFKNFLIPYLALIGLTILIWMVLPDFMFWAFLLVAAYHFGQSQLYYLPDTVKPYIKGLIYVLWGIMLLSGLWHMHWESQIANISSVFSWDLSKDGSLYRLIQTISIVTLFSMIGIFLILFITNKIDTKIILIELMVVGILMATIRILPLYTAFAIYFGLWHSLRVIFTEFYFLNKAGVQKVSVKKFIKSFIPFSVLSFAGLALLIGVSYLLKSQITPFMLFLIFISALTMPHAFFMEKMYRWLSFRKSKVSLVA
jgi:Brp/Blh family beta-carotene 15,15'-monooxygenase